MSFGEHLDELRRRLGLAILGVLPILVVALVFGQRVMLFLMRPLEDTLAANGQNVRMQVTGLLEQFNAYFYLSFILTVLIGAPWILYQLWLFIAPGLYAGERRFAYILAPLSIVLTVLSAMFTYYVMLPTILDFFVKWNAALPVHGIVTAPLPQGVVLPTMPVLAADPDHPMPGAFWINSAINELRTCVAVAADGTATVRGTPIASSSLINQEYKVSQYIDLLFNFALAFAAGFQMPVVVLVLGWVGIVTPQLLAKYRKHAIMVCAVLGAALTPGDPLSMVLLTVPLVVLFELGLLLLKLLPASRVAGDRNERAEAAAELEGGKGGDAARAANEGS
jgi:Sec-independent protein secretion pathway component TatC